MNRNLLEEEGGRVCTTPWSEGDNQSMAQDTQACPGRELLCAGTTREAGAGDPGSCHDCCTGSPVPLTCGCHQDPALLLECLWAFLWGGNPTPNKCIPKTLVGKAAALSSRLCSLPAKMLFTVKKSICCLHMIRLKSQCLQIKQEGKKIAPVAAASGEQHVVRGAENQPEEHQPSDSCWVRSLLATNGQLPCFLIFHPKK